jgi:hypothetical protein
MYFNIVITFSDLLFLLSTIPLVAIFWVLFKDWKKDIEKGRY